MTRASTAASVVLVLLVLVVAGNWREGQAGSWLRAKFLNEPDPLRWRGVKGVKGMGKSGQKGTKGVAGTWRTPASGPVISGFGADRSWRCEGCTHEGIDIGAPEGRPVRASRAGVVTWASDRGSYGLMVEVDHGDGWTTRYAHLSKVAAHVGQDVDPLERIGAIGTTGNATGGVPHLHFEIRLNDVARDPEPLLARRVTVPTLVAA